MELVAVAAVADNLVIGDEGDLPWGSLPEDKKRYRERVADDPVILGRRTFELMVDDLPGRAQIVLSRSERDYDVETAYPASGVDDAVAVAESLDADAAYVLGGAGVFEAFLPHFDRMVLTRVPGEYDGDAYFPEWSDDEWELESEEPFEDFSIQEWRRRSDGRDG